MTPAQPIAILSLFCVLASTSPSWAQSAPDGAQLFRSRCGTCHATAPGPARIGPSLAGVMGRTAGTVEGARYSTAMRASGIVWTAETLGPYLANPRDVVPGTTMVLSLRDAAQRAAVIAYLQSLPQ